MAADNLVAVIRGHAERQPDRVACGFLADGERALRTLTYAELDTEARRIADLLGDRLAPGSRAMLVYEPGLDFIAAFLGCLYTAVVAVPVFPPSPPRLDHGAAGLERVLRDCAAEAVLVSDTVAQLAAMPPGLRERLGVPWIVTDQPGGGGGDPAAWRDPGVRADSIAFLQYTSGSTTTPKGVVLRHENLLANQRAIAWALQIPSDAVMVGWLPMYHDMGLIGTVLQPLYSGSCTYLLSPFHFLQRPGRWLQAVTRFRGYISGAPNFAYELCARRVTEEERASLDLSSWRIAFNGAEPLRAATVRRFQEAFRPCGFRPESLVGCYGLAETTLLVAGAWASDPKFLAAERATLEQDRLILRDRSGQPTGLIDGERAGATDGGPRSDSPTVELVASGRIPPEHELRVVDPERCMPVGPGEIGEIWVRGPSVAAGYWRRPEETAATFGATLAGGDGARFLRTGDLGFVLDGQLYVTGRRKDLLIVRGRNVHPHDVEDIAQRADPRLRPGGGVAFPLQLTGGDGAGTAAGDEQGSEAVALIQETGESDPTELERLAAAIRTAVLEALQIRLAAVHLVPPRSVLKTSSGKLRRRATQEALHAGQLTVLYQDKQAAEAGAAATAAPA